MCKKFQESFKTKMHYMDDEIYIIKGLVDQHDCHLTEEQDILMS